MAYDDGMEFARSTFTVVRASEEEPFLRDVVAECTVPDFPDAGTNARFEWSTGTQHLELAEVSEDVVVPVSTAFDGEWVIVFQETGNPYFESIPCRAGESQESTGVFEIRNGIVVGADITIKGDATTGLEWFGTVTPGGSLEGSWILQTESSGISLA